MGHIRKTNAWNAQIHIILTIVRSVGSSRRCTQGNVSESPRTGAERSIGMKADPKFSEGARAERKAFRDKLRRELKNYSELEEEGQILGVLLQWILARQKRYDKVPGGLGKK
jgi:hypothetical protein